jgi:hypothetical protein
MPMRPDNGRRYVAGDFWGSIGAWVSGRWHTAQNAGYVAAVKQHLRERTCGAPTPGSEPLASLSGYSAGITTCEHDGAGCEASPVSLTGLFWSSSRSTVSCCLVTSTSA